MFQGELDKALSDLKHTEETFKKVNADVTRLTEELRQEQTHSEHVDRLKKGLELQIKVGAVHPTRRKIVFQELQAKLDDAEQNALRISQRAIEKLQQDVRMWVHFRWNSPVDNTNIRTTEPVHSLSNVLIDRDY